jgi:phage-related baseplate assembly protein
VSRYNAVALPDLPAPAAVEVLDYEDILQDLVNDLILRYPDYDVSTLESDPAKKILEVAAFRELVWRARVNEAVRAVMVALSKGNDLEHLGAFLGTERMLITPADPLADPPTPDVFETDAEFRDRVQLALEALTTAGSYGAYQYFARSADPRVLDALVLGPESNLGQGHDGKVYVFILSRENGGVADAGLIEIVRNYLNATERRPLTDRVIVNSATITPYNVVAKLIIPAGPDPAVVISQATADLKDYAAKRYKVGANVADAGIKAALMATNVEDVVLTSPVNGVNPGPFGAAKLGSIALTFEILSS